MKARLHRGENKTKASVDDEIVNKRKKKMWGQERANSGGDSDRSSGSDGEKKNCSADAKRTMPPAVGDQRLDLQRSLHRSASVIYTYTPCIYIYKYWTHCAKRTSPDSTIIMLRVRLICEIVRVIAWQL